MAGKFELHTDKVRFRLKASTGRAVEIAGRT
jgi:hypothetical protein